MSTDPGEGKPNASGSEPVGGGPAGAPPAQPPSWAPPPGYSPTAWSPQPAWWQPGGTPPPTAPKNRNGCLIGCLVAVGIAIVLIVALVVAGFSLLGPAMDVGMKIQQDSNGEISNVSYQWYNGVGEFRIWLAPGVPNTRAPYLACEVVRPALEGTKFEGTDFTIFGNDGRPAANHKTPCG